MEGAFQIGQEVGAFKVLRFVRSGGQGAVYEGFHVGLGRKAALKTFAPHLARNEKHVARFQREARILAQLEHPNVVKVYDFGWVGRVPYFAMEWVQGTDLSKRIEQGPMPLQDAVRAFRDVARALSAAHALGVVHRDVKPANVLLDANGQVKLTDFGVASPAPGAEAARLTREGAPIGTVAYMAPEQINGAPCSASDLYGLGCSLFEALTGRLPFDGGMMEQLAAHGSQPFPSMRGLLPRCPAPLDELLQQLGSKAYAQRPAAEETAHRLDALLGLLARDWLPGTLPLPIARARRDLRARLDGPAARLAALDYVDAVLRTALTGILVARRMRNERPEALAAVLAQAGSVPGSLGWIAALERAMASGPVDVTPLEQDLRELVLTDLTRRPAGRRLAEQLRLAMPLRLPDLARCLVRDLGVGAHPAALAVLEALDEMFSSSAPFRLLAFVLLREGKDVPGALEAWTLAGEQPSPPLPGLARPPGLEAGLYVQASRPGPVAPLATFEDGDWYWLDGLDVHGAVYRCTTTGHSLRVIGQSDAARINAMRALFPAGLRAAQRPGLELSVPRLRHELAGLPANLGGLVQRASTLMDYDPRRSRELCEEVATKALARALDLPAAQLWARVSEVVAFPRPVAAMSSLVQRVGDLGLSNREVGEVALFCGAWLALWSVGATGLLVSFGAAEVREASGRAPVDSDPDAPSLKRGAHRPSGRQPMAGAKTAPRALRLCLLGPVLEPRVIDVPLAGGAGLGRHGQNAIVIPSSYVSRHHARLEVHEARVCIHQHQPATNDSVVNGCKLTLGERHELRPGDLFFLDEEGFYVRELLR